MKHPLILLTILLCAAAITAQSSEPLPHVVKLVDPTYPADALTLGLGGKILAIIKVDAKGRITIESIAGPTAPCSDLADDRVKQLREAAEEAIKSSTFEPPLDVKGKPIDSYASVTYTVPPIRATRSGTGMPAKMVQGGVINGKAVSLPRPEYPADARAMHAGGAVSVQIVINEEGEVLSAGAVSGHPSLVKASMKAACGAKFSPTLLSGQPVKVSGVITYNFVQ